MGWGIFLMVGRAGDGAGSGFSWARGMCTSRTIPGCPWGSAEGEEQVQSRPRVARVSPASGGGGCSHGAAAPALPGPAGGAAPGYPAKIPVEGAAAIPILIPISILLPPHRDSRARSGRSSRRTGAAEPAQGAPPAASFLPRQDQRLGLTWTPVY